jgi:hypothetical protein
MGGHGGGDCWKDLGWGLSTPALLWQGTFSRHLEGTGTRGAAGLVRWVNKGERVVAHRPLHPFTQYRIRNCVSMGGWDANLLQ